MGKQRLKEVEIKQIITLRKTGHSLPEIKKITGKAAGTVFKYTRGIKITSKFLEILKIKQGGSKIRSKTNWQAAGQKAREFLPNLTRKDKLLILSALYWGEGTKRELNIINSDPELLRVFVHCLLSVGARKKDLRITLRLYEDISKRKAIQFWSKVLDVNRKQILNINILKGKKYGKLPYGMCRVRLRKGDEYFKLLMSMIALIKQKVGRHSSMDRTRDS